ncbi:MAG TPA: hypothetical protein VJ729_10455 [Nitrososphaeraceae archaeon]|nr:hypothetical protein [Nitrososphaeraceae archaeon]
MSLDSKNYYSLITLTIARGTPSQQQFPSVLHAGILKLAIKTLENSFLHKDADTQNFCSSMYNTPFFHH